jgi:uridine kinase
MIDWDEAPGVILAEAEARRGGRAHLLVAVTGPVGAGKSSLAARLSECVVRTDDFLPDHEGVPMIERDDPEHADLSGLGEVLDALLAGREAEVPVWSFHTHRREGSRRLGARPVIVCEGIHAFGEPVRSRATLLVYVEASPAQRWSRWERLERRGERGWGVERARRYFDEVAEPAFGRRSRALRSMAHIRVLNP